MVQTWCRPLVAALVRAAALVLAGLTATACAPQTFDTGAKGDEKTGTLRVWL
ncbi:hypothetical protein [Streptomyces sp. NBC_00209]|uniref:hypothetical protein n=1 Tax=Streptomyces sp. NBC_00209 TaxID=2975682 RepID=UPI0032488BF0